MQDTDLAWLAGIWDGEGSITLFTHKEADNSTKICPTVLVVNTDIHIINKIQKLLEDLKCNFVIHEHKPKNKKHKIQWRITTRNIRYIQKFLVPILPYLVGDKKAKGEIVLRYANRRIAKQESSGRYNPPYDQEDFDDLKE